MSHQPGVHEARQHPNRTLWILAIGALAYALAQTMIIPALPAIQDDTHVSESTVTWLLTAFLLSSSIATPLLGRLGDMLGKEKLLLVSLAVFGLGSLVSALGSHSITVLIVGRVIQGSGGAIFPLAFGIVRDEFPRERVATSIGLISATFGIGGGGGLVLAGVFVDHLSVAWIFWVSLGMTAIATWATWRFVPESPVRVPGRIDWGGATLLSVALIAVLLGISEGPFWGWTSGGVIGLVLAGLVLVWVFVAYERRVPEPLVDMALMARRAVWTPNVAAFAIGFAMFGSYILIPQLVQAAKDTGYGFGLSTTGAGLVMLPSALVMLFTGPLSGRLSTLFGPRLPLALGSIAAGLAYLMLGLAHGQTWLVAVAGLPLGIGIGLAYAAMATLVVAAVKATETGIATGINTIMRSIGGAVGGQIAASLLASHTLRSGVPAETGYTAAFVMSGIAAFVALAICGLIPHVAPERAAPSASPDAGPAPSPAPEEVAA